MPSWTASKSLKLICQAVKDEAAAKTLDDFDEEWGPKSPSIAPGWRRVWQEVIPFFAFPPDVRKISCITNAIESLNRAIRKFQKRGRGVRECVAARNQFTTLNPERFNK